MNNKIMISAGEASGDLHGSGLVRELLKLQPDLEISGIGGDKMRQQGVRQPQWPAEQAKVAVLFQEVPITRAEHSTRSHQAS